MQIHQYSVGRETNFAQSCKDGIFVITTAVLPHWTSIEIFRKFLLTSPIVSGLLHDPICRTTKCALEPYTPKLSTQRGENESLQPVKNISKSWSLLGWLICV